MANKLEQFLEKQIDKGNIDWENKSKLIRTSGEKINGNTTKRVKKFENKVNFGLSIAEKNKEIILVPEMLNLLGCSKENFVKLIKKMNYKSIEKENKVYFKYLPFNIIYDHYLYLHI